MLGSHRLVYPTLRRSVGLELRIHAWPKPMKRTELHVHPAQRGLPRSACTPITAGSPQQRAVGHAESPAFQCLAEMNSGGKRAPADIAPQDWDLLFRAALETLARVAVEKAATDGTGLQAPGTVLRECMDALDQLRRSVPAQDCGTWWM